MSHNALQKFSAALERAGVEYSSLHRTQTAYFAARGCGADSDALADVTLDRIARKIDRGEKVRNFFTYARAFANLVYKEYLKDRKKFMEAARELAYLRGEIVQEIEEEPDLRRRCQKSCLGELSKQNRELMTDYYVRGVASSVLAEELGLLIETLRTRIHRLKLRLKKCLEDCRRRA